MSSAVARSALAVLIVLVAAGQRTTPEVRQEPAAVALASASATASSPASATASVTAPAQSAAPVTDADADANPRGCIVLNVVGPADGEPTTLEGSIFIDTTFEHPSHGKIRPFILALAHPRCVLNGGDTKEVKEVHLAPSSAVELKPLVGKRVRVVDGVPFYWHTAWHAREVVVTTTKISVM